MDINEITLSLVTKSLWGKLSHDGSHSWLPLWIHLCDTGEIAKLLWDHWLPDSTKAIIVDGIDVEMNQCSDKNTYARKIAVFMALVHDCGKASPAFIGKANQVGFCDIVDELSERGLPFKTPKGITTQFTHAIISQAILELAGLDRSYAVVAGGHHGKPPNDGTIVDAAKNYSSYTGIGKEGWETIQKELVQFAMEQAGLQIMPRGRLSVQGQVLLTGLLIMADWIASGDGFPLISRDYSYMAVPSSYERAQQAWDELHLPEFGTFSEACKQQELFHVRFGIDTPRPMQQSALQIAMEADNLGILIIEAPMGEGKTEAALAAAEVVAKKSKLSGVYFALPTQATSDGIFKRIEQWIEKLHQQKDATIFLAHGKSGFNKDYEGIRIRSNIQTYEDVGSGKKLDQEAVIVNDWTQGRKKGLLSDFVVGTIDQILMCGLRQKHLALRHLGIVNKVVIIDECHAYDAYMSSYLDLVLSWLGAYHVPVIILSATLPPYRRKKLIEAYNCGFIQTHEKKRKSLQDLLMRPTLPVAEKNDETAVNLAYPLLSYADGRHICTAEPAKSGRTSTVKIIRINENDLVETLQNLLVDGGCVGIIRNTVKQAQETARLLENVFGEACVRLLHSRFISCDRVYKETEVRQLVGPGETNRPHKLIVIGTQVMEQSLDVDFDALFSDICPMDLLLQRMGRLHRHARKKLRPPLVREATCFVMGIVGDMEFDAGSTNVYGEYLLLKTKAFLPNRISLPDDIPNLVQQSYEDGHDAEMVSRLSMNVNSNTTIKEICQQARSDYDRMIHDKKNRSHTFQIAKPDAQGKTLVGWLKANEPDPSGKRGEATVRDASNSLEVLVIVKKTDGCFYTLSCLDVYSDIKIDSIPDDKIAKVIAGCSVSLPYPFTATWNVDKVISELEQITLDNRLDDWYESYWLNGELFLVLNEEYEMTLLNKVVCYDKKYGLYIKETEV